VGGVGGGGGGECVRACACSCAIAWVRMSACLNAHFSLIVFYSMVMYLCT